MSIITSDVCPCCGSTSISKKLCAQDFTVSHQTFQIWECNDCSLRFTQNVPDASLAGDYYQSHTYISHTNTNKGVVNKLYHLIRKKTLKRKRELIQRITHLQKGNLLDIGAGTGAFVNIMHQAGWQVTGLEPDMDTRKRAGNIYGLQLQNTDALFALPPESFDAITMWHVLEHVHELHAYMKQIKLLLKNNGTAFIAVPNYTSYDAEVYQQYWAAYDVPRHLYHFSPTALKKLLQQHELQIITAKPMWYDSFYIAMLSEKNKTNSNNFIKAGCIGLLSNIITLFQKQRCSSLIYIIRK